MFAPGSAVWYFAGLIGLAAALYLIDSFFFGVADRLHDPADQHPHRVATELPRTLRA